MGPPLTGSQAGQRHGANAPAAGSLFPGNVPNPGFALGSDDSAALLPPWPWQCPHPGLKTLNSCPSRHRASAINTQVQQQVKYIPC